VTIYRMSSLILPTFIKILQIQNCYNKFIHIHLQLVEILSYLNSHFELFEGLRVHPSCWQWVAVASSPSL
jgi:hypothetical protein